jgi:hypothetical protein
MFHYVQRKYYIKIKILVRARGYMSVGKSHRTINVPSGELHHGDHSEETESIGFIQ